MADAVAEPDKPKKGLLVPLVAGLVLAGAAGGAGYYVVTSGPAGSGHESKDAAPKALPKVSFVPLDPLLVSLGGPGQSRHLRFRAQLEVNPGSEKKVTEVLPRIADVLNGYLRAVELSDIEDPAALVRLRAQMLRRVQIIVGDGLVRDLLVMEFVLS